MRSLGVLSLLLAFAGANGCSSNPAGGGGDAGNGGGSDLASGHGGVLPAGATLGTYIALGDSISDRGGTGPFFYDLLHDDLAAKFPGLMYVHGAIAGSITDAYTNGPLPGAPTLKSQIDSLGHAYPGDVLVTITIGGNDLNGHALQAINGTDDAIRAEFAQHLADELAALTAPGRLGSGKVYVVLADIYDFTDGQGDFLTVACGPPVNVLAAKDVATFTAWNGIITDAIAHAGGVFYDLHADFMGHGYNFPEVWYDSASCIHPNTAGHAQIRGSIAKLVVGTP